MVAHTVAYQATNQYTGRLTLVFANATYQDSGDYALTVNNGIRKELVYNFSVDFISESPKVPLFSVNNASSRLVVREGDIATFNCESEGNPIPRVDVMGQRSSILAPSSTSQPSAYLTRAVFTKVMECEDSDVYICTARSGDKTTSKTVEVSVQCTPKILNSDLLNPSVMSRAGANISIPFVVQANPRPSSYSFGRESKNTQSSKRTANVNIFHTPITPWQTRVIVTVVSPDVVDSGLYVLLIGNGVGAELRYEMKLSILSGDPQILSSEEFNRDMTFKEGKDISLSFEIQANPSPSLYSFGPKNNASLGSKVTSISANVTYSSLTSWLGRVNVTMTQPKVEDSGLYVLTVGNGAGKTLTFELNLFILPASSPSILYRIVDASATQEQPSRSLTQSAYGPDHVSMIIEDETDNGVVALCPAKTTFYVTCDVAVASFQPAIDVTLHVNGVKTVTAMEVKTQAGRDVYRFGVGPEVRGQTSLTCMAMNTVFPKLKTVARRNVIIHTPDNPIEVRMNKKRVQEGETITVLNFQNVTISCFAKGGYPGLRTFFVGCGGTFHETVGENGTLDFKPDAHTTVMSCYCGVEHRQACFDQMANFTLQHKYSPNIVDFDVNNKTASVTIPSGQNASFTCSVKGNPVPQLAMTRKSYSKDALNLQTTVTGPLSVKGETTKIMRCGDSGLYTCSAQNTVGQDTKDIAVLVKCPPELQEASIVSQTDFVFRADGQGRVSIDILGFPDPDNVTVGRVSGVTGGTEMDKQSLKYKTSFRSQGLGKGRVDLDLIQVQHENAGQYVLKVLNGISPGMEYFFNVSVLPERTTNLLMTVDGSFSNGIINVCSPNTTFDVTCYVPRSFLTSVDDVTLHVANDAPMMSITTTTDREFNVFHFVVSPLTFGNVSLECVASSVSFPGLVSTVTRFVSIHAPPENPVEMRVNGKRLPHTNASFSLVSGQPATVTCRVQGGYPAQVSMTLECKGQILTTHYGNLLEHIIDVTNSMNQQVCSCKATHSTGCYSQSSEVTLDVKYSPYVTSFTVNIVSESIELPNGSDVPIVCSAQGNPVPELAIKMVGANDSLSLQTSKPGRFSRTARTSRAMTCSDLGVYECVATNEMGSDKKTVEVFVKCKPELVDRKELPHSYILPLGGGVRILFHVSGYPTPRVTLMRTSGQNQDVKGTKGTQPLDADIRYLPMTAMKTQVILQVSKFKPQDAGNYDVIIDNGNTERLTHTLTLTLQQLKEQRSDGSLLGQDKEVSIAMLSSIGGGVVCLFVAIFFLGWTAAKRKYGIKDKKCKKSRQRSSLSAIDSGFNLPNFWTLPPATGETSFTSLDNLEYNFISGEDSYTFYKGKDIPSDVKSVDLPDREMNAWKVPRPKINLETSFDNDTCDTMTM